MKQAASKGTTAKHAGTKKHATAKKHAPTAKKKTATTTHKTAKATATAKAPTTPKARKLSPGYDVACCSALAVAESLRLSGRAVGADDVFALYWRTAGDPDAGASILDALRAASVFGLAGVRPVWFGLAMSECDCARYAKPSPLIDVHVGNCVAPRAHAHAASLILGLELPGPHAVCQQDGQWWTWGEPYDPDCFPDAVIEEAWAVTWP